MQLNGRIFRPIVIAFIIIVFQPSWASAEIPQNEYILNIDGYDFPVDYTITGATITSILADKDAAALRILINAQDAGILTIVLPRIMIDSLDGEADKAFVVHLSEEGIDDGGNPIQTIEMYDDSSDYRILQFEFTERTTQIQITGTHIAPEFGPIYVLAGLMILTMLIARIARNSQ
jgi:hypothetical protein